MKKTDGIKSKLGRFIMVIYFIIAVITVLAVSSNYCPLVYPSDSTRIGFLGASFCILILSILLGDLIRLLIIYVESGKFESFLINLFRK